ncbi:MAG: hypothetical protein ABSA83_04665 [Verrucomicrobiota bacterium]|jgi:hypothetical protein
MRGAFPLLLIGWLLFAGPALAQRINQEGRILGPLPVVTNAILFDTSNADAVVSAMQIFPVSNAWNERVFFLPVLTNSDAMIAQIMSNLEASRRTLIAFQEMNYVLVPDSQALQPIDFFDYPDQSDLNGGTYPDGLYPIPANLPIEGWPTQTGTQTLAQWQTNADGSDRHAIMVAPGSDYIWETWLTQLSGTNWLAANGAEFNLNTNGLRPAGWTSGDAAGFPMFSAIVRYDEAERGMVEHACRLVVDQSLYGSYIYPATHFAASSGNTNINLPAMGQRLRLKAAFVIPASWTIEEKAVLLGLKKYGAMVADNGNFFSISVTPDDRWPANCFDDLTSISITNFEVVQTTGPNGGPRSPGAPAANAGPAQSVVVGEPAQMQGTVAFTGAPPAIQWTLYSGSGTVTFGNATQTNTTATFNTPGVYTLMLSADDSIHAVAYSAVAITVSQGIWMTIARAGANLNLTWTGGSPPYVLQQAPAFPANVWSGAVTTSTQNASLPLTTNGNAYFRVQGQ